MVVVLPVSAFVAFQTERLEATSTQRLGYGCRVLRIGDGIAGAVAQKNGDLLEAASGLVKFQAERGEIFIATAHEDADDLVVQLDQRSGDKGRAFCATGKTAARHGPLPRLRPRPVELLEHAEEHGPAELDRVVLRGDCHVFL